MGEKKKEPKRIYDVAPYRGPLVESPYWATLNAIFGNRLLEAIPGLQDVQLNIVPWGLRSDHMAGVYYPLSKEIVIFADALQRALEQGWSQVPQETLTHELIHAGDFTRNLILEQDDNEAAKWLAWNILTNMALFPQAPTLPRGAEARAYLLGLLGGAVKKPADIRDLWLNLGGLLGEPFVLEVEGGGVGIPRRTKVGVRKAIETLQKWLSER